MDSLEDILARHDEEEYIVVPSYLEKSIRDYESCEKIDWDLHYQDLDASISCAENGGEIPRDFADELREAYLYGRFY